MDRAAAVHEERRRLTIVRTLRINRDCARILDDDLRVLTNRGDSRRTDIRLCLDGEVLSAQIEIERPLIRA